MKKLLLLGAGNAQIDAIEYCHENGIYVAGCSYTNTDAGIPLLDAFRQTDIKDVEGVVAFAREQAVDAIYSIGSDLAIPTAMKASETLGLPHFISSETAEKCHSKHLMRQALGNDFEGNLDFIVCDNVKDAKAFLAFPGMMKPVDSQGQRGCFRVDSIADIEKNFATSFDYSVQGKVIIEEFVDGPEISVNSYFQNGEMKFALVSDRHVFEEYPGGIIKKHTVPSAFARGESEAEALDVVKRSCRALGIDNGPCYHQIKLDSSGHPKILEIAPRLDGCHMWNLIKHYCGVDLLDACMSHLLYGKEVLTDSAATSNDSMVLEFLSEVTGVTLNRTDFDTADALYVNWYYNTGDTVKKLNGYIEKCGYMIRREDR